MQTKEYRSLGLKANILVPATPDEYDKNAGRANATLDDAVDNTVYRGVLTGVRSTFCEAVEKDTGIARKTVTVKKGEKDVTNYDESEGDYINRVKLVELKLDDAAYAARFQPLMDAAVAHEDNVFDASEKARVGKPKKLAETYTIAATRVFANGNQDKIANKIAKESGTVCTFVAEEGDEAAVAAARAKNIEALGWAIKANEAFKEKERQAQYA